MYEVRVTGLKLPVKVSDERKRKAYKNAEKNGKQLTEKEMQMLNWFLVITNVPEDMFVSIQKFIRNFRNNLKPLVCAFLNPTKKFLKVLEQKIKRVARRSFFDRQNRKQLKKP